MTLASTWGPDTGSMVSVCRGWGGWGDELPGRGGWREVKVHK